MHFEFVFLLSLFVASVGVSWALHAWRRPVLPAPPQNTRIRLRRGASVYVCHVVGTEGRMWRITAPFIRSEVIPLRPSESFLADFTTEQGVASFFTRVLRRENRAAELIIQAPEKLNLNERRGADRVAFLPGLQAKLGKFADVEVRDISARGALIHTQVPVRPGAHLTVSVRDLQIEALTLSCEETGSKVWPGYAVRLLFMARLTVDELGLVSEKQ